MGDNPIFTLESVNSDSWSVEPYVPEKSESATIAYYYPNGPFYGQQEADPQAPVIVQTAPAPAAIVPAPTSVHISPAQLPTEKTVVVDKSYGTHGCVKASIVVLFFAVLAVAVWLALVRLKIV